MPEIRITCKTDLNLPLDELHETQGNLKVMTDDGAEKLWKSIVKYGFRIPIFVWKEIRKVEARIMGGQPETIVTWHIIDGHGRVKLLRKKQSQGYTVPELPAIALQADNIEEAKSLVPIVSSQFHTMTDEGLYEFMTSMGYGVEFLDEVQFDSINKEEFIEEYYELDETKEEKNNTSFHVEFDAYQNAAIKQVVLLYQNEQYPIVLGKLDQIMKSMGAADYSQVVWNLVHEKVSA